MLLNTIIDKKKCCGCMACINKCPHKAISVKKDEYGFVYPVIDETKCIHCGLCKKVCPQLSHVSSNTIQEYCVAQTKDLSLSNKSASGGIFAQLARYVLSKGGIVFGCTLEKSIDKFEVKHTSIDSEKDLYKLQGSKYVQSHIGDSYIKVQNFLKNGRVVLFSGTPCQVAGLKTYLRQDYDNLICIDLSCTGIPSQQIFNDYIKYLEKNIIKYPIVDIKFRSKKRLGWNKYGLVISYQKNGKIYDKIIEKQDSSYFSLFVNMQILRESCYHCQYAGLKRISDITIADAWGINTEYPNIKQNGIDPKKGVSLVLINTNKGKNIFKNIQDSITYMDVDISKLVKYNHPLRCSSVLTDSRKYYLDLYKNGEYALLDQYYNKNEIVQKKNVFYQLKRYITEKQQSDCLLMTMYANPNYGSVLTTYALQKTLKNMGYNPKIINYAELHPIFKPFYLKYCDLTEPVRTKLDFYLLNKQADTFILGSDNLINCKTDSFEYVTRNLFNYTQSGKKRIMISGSMGDWDGHLNHKKHLYFQALLKRFTYLSTREEHGKKVLEKVFKCSADWLNDPVFLLDKEEYVKLAQSVTDTNDHTKIMKYILYPNAETDKICNYLSEKLGLKCVQFEGNENAHKYTVFNQNVSVQHWLSAIIHSNLIITDSFHCVVFALIFNKKFICIKNSHALVRFTSLFQKLGVNITPIETINDLPETFPKYDWQKVNKHLSEIQKYGQGKIAYALKLKPKVSSESNKIIRKYIFSSILHSIQRHIFSMETVYKKNTKRKVVHLFGIKLKLIKKKI